MTSEEPTKYTMKRDQYSRARGSAQFLDLFCASCRRHLVLYQKDGPGSLKRLYLDRIFAPHPFSEWRQLDSLSDVPNLTCPYCGALIGSPMIYRSENRLAIRLQAGTFHKVRSKGIYPPSTPDTSES